MSSSSPGQAAWRERFDFKHRYGIPVHDHHAIQRTGGASIMAKTLKLPERANKVSYDTNEVLDARLTLLNPDLPKGEGVVVADGLDTEPKARVRCRNMVELLKTEQTVTADLIPAEFWQDDENLAEWIGEYEDQPAEDAAEDAEPTYTFPSLKVRTHTVEQPGATAKDAPTYAAVLSIKP